MISSGGTPLEAKNNKIKKKNKKTKGESSGQKKDPIRKGVLGKTKRKKNHQKKVLTGSHSLRERVSKPWENRRFG